MSALKYLVVLAGLVLAAGMASAAYLNVYGEITGSADVEGPYFYSTNDSQLLFNKPPNASQQGMDYIGSYQVSYYSSRDFDKEWYPVETTMHVKAKLFDSNSPETTMQVSFEYVNETGQYSVCDSFETVRVDSTSYKNYSATCKGNITGEVKNFEYVIRGTSNTEVFIKTDGLTGVEVRGR